MIKYKKLGVILGLVALCLLLWSAASHAGKATSPAVKVPDGIATSPSAITMPPVITVSIGISPNNPASVYYPPYWPDMYSKPVWPPVYGLWPPVYGMNCPVWWPYYPADTADAVKADNTSTSPDVGSLAAGLFPLI